MKRCTRLDLDSEIEKFIKIGKDLGLEGDQLLQFAERKEAEAAKKEAEAIEREERNKERELRKLEIEADAEKKRLEADAENKRLEADAENKRLEADKEKQRLEAENKRIEAEKEKQRLEAVEAEKRRAHELEMKRLELSVATPGTPQEPRSDQSARAPKLPAFNENTDKMDAYLERFERFAKNNKWQEDVWATRLSALLTGKSLEFYSRLSREEADDYRMLKLALLRHYDYTEEGYRRKFRGCKPEEGETPALFIERIKSYLEKWIETAGLGKAYEALRDLFIKEQTLNACPRELAAHLREQKDQSLQALADAAKRYLEAHNMKFAHKTQRAYVEERSDESSGGRGGASNQPICFACGSQGHRAARCPFRQPPRDGSFKRQEYPGKKSTPSPQHKAASIVMPAEETSERKQYCGQRGSRPGGRQVERICHSDSCRWHGENFSESHGGCLHTISVRTGKSILYEDPCI